MMLHLGAMGAMGAEEADIVMNVDWPADRPGQDPGWRWEDLPDQVGPTVLPSAGYKGPGIPEGSLPAYLDPSKTGVYQRQASGTDILPTGGIDIGIPGFGLGPDVNIDYPGRDTLANKIKAALPYLAIGAVVLGVVVVGQVRR